jgi:uncharacterized cupin superfamily protein
MSDQATSVGAKGIFEPFRIDRVPWEKVFRGERYGMEFQVLSQYGGGSQITVCMEILPPGRQANQVHYHMLEEEHVLVLDGTMTIRLGDKTHVVDAGHYVCFPAGQKIGHSLFNHSMAPCRYLIIGNPQPHDVVVFPETGRVGVKLTGEGYRKAHTMEYWEDVAT